jgi:hypothetical protein
MKHIEKGFFPSKKNFFYGKTWIIVIFPHPAMDFQLTFESIVVYKPGPEID